MGCPYGDDSLQNWPEERLGKGMGYGLEFLIEIQYNTKPRLHKRMCVSALN